MQQEPLSFLLLDSGKSQDGFLVLALLLLDLQGRDRGNPGELPK